MNSTLEKYKAAGQCISCGGVRAFLSSKCQTCLDKQAACEKRKRGLKRHAAIQKRGFLKKNAWTSGNP